MNILIERAIKLSEAGAVQESNQLFEKALHKAPNDPEVLYFCAVNYFQRAEYAIALDLFISCYSCPKQTTTIKQEIFEHILNAYYEPNSDKLQAIYNNNLAAFQRYEHNFIELTMFEDLPCLYIPRNASEYYVYDKKSRNFTNKIILQDQFAFEDKEIATNRTAVTFNIFELDNLLTLSKKIPSTEAPQQKKIAIYIVWQDKVKRSLLLQVNNYQEVIQKNRFVFFPSYSSNEFNKFLQDAQTVMPTQLFGGLGTDSYLNSILQVLNDLIIFREEKHIKNCYEVENLASQYTNQYYKKLFTINKSDIKILFITQRSTMVHKYNIQDIMESCRDKEIQCDVFIEKSDIHRFSEAALTEKIMEFEPNIIFEISAYRSFYKSVPKEIIWINWLQDTLPYYFSKEVLECIDERQYILAAIDTYIQRLTKAGVKSQQVLHQYNPYNHLKYYPREVSESEKNKYLADIAFFGHMGRPDVKLAESLIKAVNLHEDERTRKTVTKIIIHTYETIWLRNERGKSIYTIQQCHDLLNELGSEDGITFDSEFAENFFVSVVTNLDKKIRLSWIDEWLAEREYSMKIWGREWATDREFKKYAVGTVEQGEEKAKAFSCTKILIANLSYSTAHFRAFEATACGALCLIRHIPPEFDHEDIRKYLTENEHFVFFYDKQDLYKKLDYYLNNETERIRIVENAKEKLGKIMTYDIMVDRMLAFVGDDILQKND